MRVVVVGYVPRLRPLPPDLLVLHHHGRHQCPDIGRVLHRRVGDVLHHLAHHLALATGLGQQRSLHRPVGVHVRRADASGAGRELAGGRARLCVGGREHRDADECAEGRDRRAADRTGHRAALGAAAAEPSGDPEAGGPRGGIHLRLAREVLARRARHDFVDRAGLLELARQAFFGTSVLAPGTALPLRPVDDGDVARLAGREREAVHHLAEVRPRIHPRLPHEREVAQLEVHGFLCEQVEQFLARRPAVRRTDRHQRLVGDRDDLVLHIVREAGGGVRGADQRRDQGLRCRRRLAEHGVSGPLHQGERLAIWRPRRHFSDRAQSEHVAKPPCLVCGQRAQRRNLEHGDRRGRRTVRGSQVAAQQSLAVGVVAVQADHKVGMPERRILGEVGDRDDRHTSQCGDEARIAEGRKAAKVGGSHGRHRDG